MARAADTEERDLAYEHLQAGRWEAAAQAFSLHLQEHPDDAQAGLDYVNALFQLGRFEPAAQWLETMRRQFPERESLTFRLGTAYANLNQPELAAALFESLQSSTNPALARAATESLTRLRAEQAGQRMQEESEALFARAREGDPAGVVALANQMESRSPLPIPLAMQRLYALYQLQEYETALDLADRLAAAHPGRTDLAFLRAELRVQLKRPDEAAAILERIESLDPESPDGIEARRRRLALQPGPMQPAPPAGPASSPEALRIYAMAKDGNYAEVVAAVDALPDADRSFPLALQRLYALDALGRHERALQEANRLAETHPNQTNLVFLRAELLVKAGQPDDARALWRSLEARHAGTPVAEEAARRRHALNPAPAQPPGEEDQIYALATEGRHEEVLQAIHALELKEPLSPAMERQRLFALQLTGRTDEALARATVMAAARPEDAELALLQADLLYAGGHWKEAAALLVVTAEDHVGTPAADAARARLQNIPSIARPDKWYWGEAYASGDYYGRFGEVVGSGLIRHGYFIPGARWLQPYGEFRFGVDTAGGVAGQRSEVADNHVGFYGGVRAQPWEKEYLFAYAQGGVNKDLLDVRDDGDWSYDYQVGVYAYKGWGPGLPLLDQAPEKPPPDPDRQPESGPGRLAPGLIWDPFWRLDWFVDGNADFSYYHRYASALGFAQFHQGFRLFQIGPTLAFDTYIVENVAWDVKGNFYDNLAEVGPGARWVWVPCGHAYMVLRAEYLNGFYFGRDGENNRGDTPGHYDEARVGLSAGMRW